MRYDVEASNGKKKCIMLGERVLGVGEGIWVPMMSSHNLLTTVPRGQLTTLRFKDKNPKPTL